MAPGALYRKSLVSIESAIREEEGELGRSGFLKVAALQPGTDFQAKKELQRTLSAKVKMVAEEVINPARFTREAIATTTAGAAMGVHAQRPSLVFPTSLPALLNDSTINVDIPPGSNTARWATFTHLAFSGTTENTEPAQASQTLTTADAVAIPYAAEQQISFEAFKKIPGIMQAMVTAARLGELLQRDALVLNQADATSGIAATVLPSGRANEAAIISTDTMTSGNLDDAINDLTSQGYTADDLVWVGHPNQWNALLKDSGLTKVVGYEDFERLSAGIAFVNGVECRRSTQVPTGTGSASITTYHSFLYKKNYTLGFGNSAELTIEWFRNIRTNSLFFKSYTDAAVKTLAPLSLVRVITA